MALPDYFKQQQGTLVSWRASGGDAVLTLTSLSSGNAYMGASVDLGSTSWEQEYACRLVAEFATAPTSGEVVTLRWAFSDDNSVWPAGVSGSDAQYKSTEEDEWLLQLGIPVASLNVTNDGSGTVQVGPWFRFKPRGRYIVPVVYNESGQATTSTAANNRVDLLPLRSLIQDAA